MRVKYGGGTIDLKLAGAKLWAGVMLALFVISTIYFLSNVHKPDDISNSEFETPSKRNIPAKPLEPPREPKQDQHIKGKRYDDERTYVPMVMDSAKSNYESIIIQQKDMLTNQVRPDDTHYNINVTLSDKISMDRKLFDSRPPVCREFHYNLNTLPKASVIVPFYNEALSMLLRTIHSILNNSPDSLLNEVCLIIF